jgi:hypothetical protein
VARADLLINLVRANSRGDSVLFRRTLEAMIAEERAKQHHVLADRLSEYLNGNGLVLLCQTGVECLAFRYPRGVKFCQGGI